MFDKQPVMLIQSYIPIVVHMANNFESSIIKIYKQPNKIEPPVRFVPENVDRANGL